MALDIDKLVDVARSHGAMSDMEAFQVTRQLPKKNERKWLIDFATRLCSHYGEFLHVAQAYHKQLDEAGMEPKDFAIVQLEYVKARKEEEDA
jgi:hypothetical protein